jgi:sugar O-acyltransferase (sialic acid O-acetyltransferase NeuD family)
MNFAIFGDGSHARVVSNQLEILGNSLPIIVGTSSEGDFLGQLEAREETVKNLCYHVAIGNNKIRESVSLKIAQFLPAADVIVSRASTLEESAQVGSGSFIAPMAYVGMNALVGQGCIFNTGSIVDHDVQIGDYSHLGGNSYVAGGVKIGDHVFLGAGCTIIEGLRIASNVTIGAGAVVIRDIEEPGLYVGIPARLKV